MPIPQSSNGPLIFRETATQAMLDTRNFWVICLLVWESAKRRLGRKWSRWVLLQSLSRWRWRLTSGLENDSACWQASGGSRLSNGYSNGMSHGSFQGPFLAPGRLEEAEVVGFRGTGHTRGSGRVGGLTLPWQPYLQQRCHWSRI